MIWSCFVSSSASRGSSASEEQDQEHHTRAPGVVDAFTVTAAHSLSLDDDLDVFPLDDLSGLPPEIRAAVERAETEGASGRVVSHARIEEGLRAMQRP